MEKPLLKIAYFKTRHRYQYRWPDDDFYNLMLTLQATLTFTQTKVLIRMIRAARAGMVFLLT